MTPASWRSFFLVVLAAATSVESSQLNGTCSNPRAAPAAEEDTTSLIQDISLKAIRRSGQKEDQQDLHQRQATVLAPAKPKPSGTSLPNVTTPYKESPAAVPNPNKIFISSASSAIVAASVVGVFLIFAFLMCYTQLKSKVDAKAPLAWFFLSSFIAVFCAALICTALRDFSTWGIPQIIKVEPILMDVMRLGVIYLVVQFLLLVTKSNFWVLEGVGAVGSFMLGFALAEVYGKLLKMPTFSSSWLIVAMTVLSAWMITLIIVVGLYALRECCHPSGSRLSEIVHGGHWLQWHDVCGDVEVVAAAVGLGSVMCKVITYVILEEIAANGKAVTVTIFDALILGAVAIVILGLVMILCRVQFQHDHFGEHMTQVESFVLHTLGMTAAWCSLTAGQWVFWDGLVADTNGKNTDQVSSRLLMAGTFTAAIVLVLSLLITVTGMSGSRGKYLQVMSCSLALLLGLAWEAWYARAALAYGRLVQACLCLALCLLLLTVWGLYILPHAVHKKWLLESGAESVEDALKAPGQNVQHRVASVLHPVPPGTAQSHSSSYSTSAETRHSYPPSTHPTSYPSSYPPSSQVHVRRS
mmetsp:Transcript_148450/g.262058  ORF Transcript_148450/g.262058 Transcript_148450/m.262058 type:complete len:583 (-) Transcript_148450:154-1902(-)